MSVRLYGHVCSILPRSRGDDFQLVLTRYAGERLLYRLTLSEYQGQFVLKGATLFTIWTGEPHRATRDIDLLGFGDPSEDHLRSVFEKVLAVDCDEDGVEYDVGSLSVGPIRIDVAYGGIRATLNAFVAKAKVRLQVDIGFGDAITPEAEVVELPTLLDFPSPKMRAYPRETVVAEKVEAMVKLGIANSRMKDFYDIAVLCRDFAFDGKVLAEAIEATFAQRETQRPAGLPLALTSEFGKDPTKNIQWNAFIRKIGARPIGDLPAVIEVIARFAEGPLTARDDFQMHWPPGGPWEK